MKEKTQKEILQAAEEHFKICPYCRTGEAIIRLTPPKAEGIYAFCSGCGATGGIGRYKSVGDLNGRLYSYWKAADSAPDLEDQDTITDEEMLSMLRSRPELRQLWESYSSLPDKLKPAALRMAVSMMQDADQIAAPQ